MTRLPIVNADPGDDQDHLFPPDQTLPPKCACGTTRKNLCRHDADIEEGHISRHARRPRTCLNSYDPATAPIPYA